MESKSTHTIVAVIAGLVIGLGGGYAIGNSSDNMTSNSSMGGYDAVVAVDSTAADTRVALNNALREHVNLAGVALRNVYTGSPDADAAVSALDNNSIEVAGLVGSVYGEAAEESFLSLWRSHIGFFADYTVAAKSGDKDAMEKALADLDGYTEDASIFFSNANPNLPKEAVKEALQGHKSHVIDTINAIGAGDFDKAYVMLGEAADQVGQVADVLAAGIVKQSPDKF